MAVKRLDGRPNSAVTAPRSSHAVLDYESRRRKAELVVGLIEDVIGAMGEMDVLEVGTGSGYMSSLFAPRCRSFISIDVADERQQTGFEFQRVTSELLPFELGSFDLVISNHVIEHVEDQALHLAEMRRVLRPEGGIYLSTPNRFALKEPHFRLPLLGWLPSGWRDSYVRLARRGEWFDVKPLSYGDLAGLAGRSHLSCRDVSVRMVAARLKPISNAIMVALTMVWPIVKLVGPTSIAILRPEEAPLPQMADQ